MAVERTGGSIADRDVGLGPRVSERTEGKRKRMTGGPRLEEEGKEGMSMGKIVILILSRWRWYFSRISHVCYGTGQFAMVFFIISIFVMAAS